MKQGGAHLTKPGWSKPHTHSNPTNLTLFRHKITLYRFNQGGSYDCRGAQMGAGGLSPLTLTTDCNRRIKQCQDCVLPTRRLWLIWSKMLMTICLTVFCTIMKYVLNLILPTKTESILYQLRPRRHNRSLTMKANATNECDFIVSMLFKDIY